MLTAADESEDCALILAVKGGHSECVALLIRLVPRQFMLDGPNLLHLAAAQGEVEVVKLLLGLGVYSPRACVPVALCLGEASQHTRPVLRQRPDKPEPEWACSVCTLLNEHCEAACVACDTPFQAVVEEVDEESGEDEEGEEGGGLVANAMDFAGLKHEE